MKKIEIKDDLLEELSAKDHDAWREYKVSMGYHLHRDCPFKHQPKCGKCNDLLIPFAELPEHIKEINRLHWKTAVKALAASGLTIVDASELEELIAEKEALENAE